MRWRRMHGRRRGSGDLVEFAPPHTARKRNKKLTRRRARAAGKRRLRDEP